MASGTYIAQLIASIFFMIVGIRLVRLHRRTGEAPERLLGIYFLLTGFAYVGWQIPVIFHLEAAGNPFELAGWALYAIGVVPFLFFTRMVFRPNTGWANAIVGLCTLGLLVGTGSWIIQGRVYYALDSPVYLGNWLGYTIPCIWLTVEAFLAYGRASRRVQIGLCERIVANRYLLFACFGAFQTFACITDVFLELEYMSSQVYASNFDLILGANEMAGIVMLFLAFFPPAFYQRWLATPVGQASS